MGLWSKADWTPYRGTLTLSQPHLLWEKEALCRKAQPVFVVNKKAQQWGFSFPGHRCSLETLLVCFMYLQIKSRTVAIQRERDKDIEWGGGIAELGGWMRDPERGKTQSEEKYVPVQTCLCLPVDPSVTHMDRAGPWLGERWKHYPVYCCTHQAATKHQSAHTGSGSGVIGRKSAKSINTTRRRCMCANPKILPFDAGLARQGKKQLLQDE